MGNCFLFHNISPNHFNAIIERCICRVNSLHLSASIFSNCCMAQRNWLLREEFILWQKHHWDSTGANQKGFVTPFHIKLGILKNCITVLNQEGNAVNDLCRYFSRLSGMKRNEGGCLNLNVEILIVDEGRTIWKRTH